MVPMAPSARIGPAASRSSSGCVIEKLRIAIELQLHNSTRRLPSEASKRACHLPPPGASIIGNADAAREPAPHRIGEKREGKRPRRWPRPGLARTTGRLRSIIGGQAYDSLGKGWESVRNRFVGSWRSGVESRYRGGRVAGRTEPASPCH